MVSTSILYDRNLWKSIKEVIPMAISKLKKTVQNVKDQEFSKRFTISIRNCMFVHLALTVIGVIALTVFGYDADYLVTVLITMMPVYIALQGANYVKSGYENGKKIQSGHRQEESENG